MRARLRNQVVGRDTKTREGSPTAAYIAQGASYVVDAVILFLYHLAGTTTASFALVYLIAGVGWTTLTLALSESYLNDSFEDHYLTVPQSIVSITIQLGAIYLAPEVGFYFACIIFIVLGFGALRMSARQTGGCGLMRPLAWR